ncbi:PqqD family protein [Macrococcus sp. FSL R5-0951]|uniref:PqqD family protein n=1 Tax=Macrococcoides TaxID=3076173 RepID=UPI001C5D6C64|nr:PqqD family protein [Macrococcus bohemicus]QYA46051.1 PqqD family protein [Macrococcus bohemicus]
MSCYQYSQHIAFQKEPSTSIIYILDKKFNEMILLDETSAEIWNLLAGNKDANSIIEILCDRYDKSDFLQIKENVYNFLDELAKRGIIYESENT